MRYKKKKYIIENVKAELVAKRFKTPCYCYSYKKLKKNIKNFKNRIKKIKPLTCFAVKANPNKALLREIGKLGLGADVVSIGELMKALKAGIKPNKIVFSGVGKTSDEIEYAIKKKILLINAESKSEILEIEKIAKKKKKKVDIGIRLNPNTDAKTLKQISTGKKENKFGIPEKTFLKLTRYVINSNFLNLKCLSVHIGSQILDIKPYEKMLNVLNRIIKKIQFDFEYIDLGGGIGIDYENKNKKLNLKKYSNYITKFLKGKKSKIIFEPGRSIIGNTGILISKISLYQRGIQKDFVILDAAMNDLMRPALYNANHRIIPVTKNNHKSKKSMNLLDLYAKHNKFSIIKNFQKLKEKELIIICDVGAYGMSLSSNYNLRTKPCEILINNTKIQTISKRQSLKDLI